MEVLLRILYVLSKSNRAPIPVNEKIAHFYLRRNQIMRDIKIIGLLLFGAVSILAGLVLPNQLDFHEDIAQKLPTLIGYIFLISLFVERAIEVFLSAWRSDGADNLDFKITYKNKEIENHSGEDADVSKSALYADLERLEKDRVFYSAKSRSIAQWTGLTIGICISFIGIRVLGNIVNPSTLTSLQMNLFVTVDVIITAAVLAGGSDAINKMMKVYNSFMSATEKKTK